MYIIIHKYQRWPGNVETKQKYLKNMPKEKHKQHIKIWFVGQEDQKPVYFSKRSMSSEIICTLHVWGRERGRRRRQAGF